jgi:hypothetical protein
LKKFKVKILIPQERTIEAIDLQDAHNQVTAMMNRSVDGDYDGPRVHSIEEVQEQEVIDFGPSPAE